MSVYKGQTLTLSIFGTSHGPSIGMTLSGIPSEASINLDVLQEFMARRAPGNSPFSTSRKEPDIPEFVSGLKTGSSRNSRNLTTDGSEIKAIIYNRDVKSSDYSKIANTPRPGHADYTAHVKYGGTED